MSDQTVSCIICGGQCTCDESHTPESHCRINGCKCCPYIILSRDIDTHHKDSNWIRSIPRNDLTRLLRERSHKERYHDRHSIPILLFDNKDAPDIPNGVPLRVNELLATWPKTVPEQIERALCNLIYSNGHLIPGQPISLRAQSGNDGVFLTNDWMTQEYMLKAMCRYGWLRPYGPQTDTRDHILEPEGWQKFDELTRSSSNVNNPAFVAMWFGGKTRSLEMRKLFDQAIGAAIIRAGYKAKRADSDEHNEPIMDKILYDIQIAPFVVAELTRNNQGVYYEAGYARGRGLDVIVCVRKGQTVHFDLTGMSQVKWKTPSHLAERLEARIRATQGQGPYDPPAGEVASKG